MVVVDSKVVEVHSKMNKVLMVNDLKVLNDTIKDSIIRGKLNIYK